MADQVVNDPYAPRTDAQGIQNRLTYLRPQFADKADLDDVSFSQWYTSAHPADRTLSDFASGRVSLSPPAQQVAGDADIYSPETPQLQKAEGSFFGDLARGLHEKVAEGEEAAKDYFGVNVAAEPDVQTLQKEKEAGLHDFGPGFVRGMIGAGGSAVESIPVALATEGTSAVLQNAPKLRYIAAPIVGGLTATAQDAAVREEEPTVGSTLTNIGGMYVGQAAGALGKPILRKIAPALAENSLARVAASTAVTSPIMAGYDLATGNAELSDFTSVEKLTTRIATDAAWGAHDLIRTGLDSRAKARENKTDIAAKEFLGRQVAEDTSDISDAVSVLNKEKQAEYKETMGLINEEYVRRRSKDPADAADFYNKAKGLLSEQIAREGYQNTNKTVAASALSDYLRRKVAEAGQTGPRTPRIDEDTSASREVAPTGATMPPEAAALTRASASERPTELPPVQPGETPDFFNRMNQASSSRPLTVSPLEVIAKGTSIPHEEAVRLVRERGEEQAAKFIESIRNTNKEVIKTDLSADRSSGAFYPKHPDKVRVDSINNGLAESARTFAHEVSHQGLFDVYTNDPTAYGSLVDTYRTLSSDDKLQILSTLAESAGFKNKEQLDYYAGHTTPFSNELQGVAEFNGGIVTIALHDALVNRGKGDGFSKVFARLPRPIQQFISKAVRTIRQTFQRASGTMDKATYKKFNDAITAYQENLGRSEHLQELALRSMRSIDVLDPTNLEKNLNSSKRAVKQTLPPASEFWANLAGDDFEKTKEALTLRPKQPGTEKVTWLERHVIPMLQTSMRFPEIRPAFDALVNHMGLVNAKNTDAMATIGGYGKGASLAEGLTKAEQLRRSFLHNPELAKTFGRAGDENQIRRKNGDPLLTVEELRDKYRVPENRVNEFKGLLELGDVVAKQVADGLQEKNATLFGQELFRVNPGMGVDKAAQIGSTFGQQAIDMGMLTHERRSLLKEREASPLGDPNRDIIQSQLNQIEAKMKVAEDATFRRLVDMGFNAQQAESTARVLNEKMKVYGHEAVQWGFMTQHGGYLPKTRRGKYIAFMRENGVTTETFDSNNYDKVFDWVKSKGKKDVSGVLDKKAFEKKFQNIHLDDIERLKNEQRDLLSQIAADTKLKYAGDTNVQAALDQMVADYTVPEADYRAALAVKGDSNRMRREDVAGFNPNDYLANIYEYARRQNARTQREITKAKINMQLMDPFYAQHPDLHDLVKSNKDYVLNGTQGDWAAFRNLTNTWQIGGSVHQLAMNGFQQVQNGIPMMIERMTSSGKNFGPVDASALLAKSVKESAGWFLNGEVKGDSQLSELLAVAKKEGITTPNSIEMVLPKDAMHTDAIAQLSDILSDGKAVNPVVIAARVNALRGFGMLQNILRSTAALGESINRNISFIQGVEMARRLGIKDEKKIFDFASRFTNDVNFEGGKANRPGFVRDIYGETGMQKALHGAALTMLSLRGFTLNHIGQVIQLMRDNKLGQWDYSLDKRVDRRKSYKAGITAIAALALIGGASGLLGVKDMEEILKATSADGTGIEHELRKAMANGANLLGYDNEDPRTLGVVDGISNALFRGLPAAVTGIDTSGAGMGSPFGISSQHTIGENVGSTVMGAPGSTLAQIGLGTKKVFDTGSFKDGLALGGPSAVKQFIKADEIARTGMPLSAYTGKPVSARELTTLERAGEGLGFPSMGRVETTRQSAYSAGVQEQLKSMSDAGVKSISEALRSGDEKTAQRKLDGLLKSLSDKGFEVDPMSIISSVSKEVSTPRGTRYLSEGTPATDALTHSASSLLRSRNAAYRPKGSEDLDLLTTALALGQPQVVVEAVKRLGSAGVGQKQLVDILVQTGNYSPLQARRLLLQNTASSQRRLMSGMRLDEDAPVE